MSRGSVQGRSAIGAKRGLSVLTASSVVAATLTFAVVAEVASAPPAAAALTCPSVSGALLDPSGNTCEYSFTSSGTYSLPSGMSLGYSIQWIGGGGGGGGGQASGGNLFGFAGNPSTPSSAYTGTSESISITVGGGGTGGLNATSCTDNDAGAGTAGGDTSVVGYAEVSQGGTGGPVGGAAIQQNGSSTVFGTTGSSGAGGKCRDSGSVPTRATGGGGGAVVVIKTMATVTANRPTVDTPTDDTLTVRVSAPTAFPQVTTFRATCTSSNGGTTVTGTGTSPILIPGASRGKSYTCTAEAFNTAYGSPSLASTPAVTIPGQPQSAGAPSFTGTPALTSPEQVLDGDPGSWTDFGFTIDDTEYEWQVASSPSGPWGAAPDDSTLQDYTITDPALAGKYLRLGVRTKNLYGWSAWAYSAASQQITAQPAFTAASPPTVADVNRPYGTYRFAASGYRVTFSEDSAGLTGLPPGMSIDDTGDLTGTPTLRGEFTYRVKAENDSGSGVTSPLTLTVSSGVASTVRIVTQPVGGPSRELLATQPIVEVLDDSGLLVRDDTLTVTSTGSVGGSQVAGLATTNGVATFTDLTLGGLVDTDYTLTFIPTSSPSAAATSEPTRVTPGLATTLEITTPPVAGAQAGAVMTTQPVVHIEDADGNLVTYDDTTIVTLTPEAGGFVGPTQASTAVATAVDGVAAFSGVRFGGPTGVSKILTFTATRDNVGPALADDSASVVSTATGPAYKLVITTEATSPSASGAAFTQPPIVERQDMAGNAVGGDPQSTVTATLVEEAAPYDVLVGSTIQPTLSGVATFTGLGVSGLAGTTYTIRFSAPGLVSADDTVVPSTGAAVRLSLTAVGASPPGNASYDDSSINPQPKVQVVDSGNNPIADTGVVVTATIVSGSGSLVDDSASTNVNGLAEFNDLSLIGLTGTYVLRFSATGYTSIDDTVLMLRGSQTVTLSPVSTKTYGAEPFAVSASTTSGLIATLTTTTPGVCSVSGNASASGGVTGGAVSVLGAGSCTIVASQPGNADFEPAVDDSLTFTVNKANQQTLTVIAPSTATAGQEVTLATVGGSGLGAVTYSTTTSALCAVDPSAGIVTFTGVAGSCLVAAQKAGDGNFNGPNASSAVGIAIAAGAGGLTPQTVAFVSASPSSPVVDDTYVASATATSGLAVTIAVLSGPCSAATGTSPVTVTFTGTGTCVLEATQAGDSQFAAASPAATQTILVYASSGEASSGPRNQSISFAQPLNRRLGAPNFRLSASASSQLAVTFTTTTPAVCTVTVGGIVQLVSAGACTIEADQAGNSIYAQADTVTRSFSVTAGLPSAPRILSSSAGAGSATLSFAAPDDTGGAAIVAYSIVATPAAGGATVSSSGCLSSPCTVSGLIDDSAYTLRIAAINAIGTGPYSVASASVTPKTCGLCPGAPGAPGSPGGPAGERLDDTTVILTWSQPTALGDDTFVSYDIYYRALGTSWPNLPEQSIGVIATTSTTITGLTPGIVYEFLIVVVTVANPRVSPPDPGAANAAVTTVGTPTAPMPPQDLDALYVTDTSIVVSWAYSPNDGGSPITGYSVTLSGGARCSAPILDDTTATATCQSTGLTTGTTYAIGVVAINAIGSSDPAVDSYTTPGVRPAPPLVPPSSPLTVIGVGGDASAQITWSAPSSAGSFPVTNYQVVVSPGGRSCLATAPTLSCTVTGLANGTTYTATVRALNGAGWGPYSEASNEFTPRVPEPVPPGPVRDLEVVRVTAKGVLVLTWRAPLRGPVTTYRVGVRQAGEENYSRVRPDPTTTSIRITGLEPGGRYWVRVRAGNDAGFGPGVRYAERIRIPLR